MHLPVSIGGQPTLYEFIGGVIGRRSRDIAGQRCHRAYTSGAYCSRQVTSLLLLHPYSDGKELI